MLTVAFWNIHRKNVVAEVVALAEFLANSSPSVGRDVILCLAEPSGIDRSVLGKFLGPGWSLLKFTGPRFVIISNIASGQIVEEAIKRSACYIAVIRPTRGTITSLNLCFAHLGSPLGKWYKDTNATTEAIELREDTEEFEKGRSEFNTVIIGDLNMDPYDPAMIAAKGLHSAMCRTVAQQGSRTFTRKGVKGDPIRIFYNPTWRLLGDQTPQNQPGSFYNPRDITDALVWHCIDQVLVTPSLISLIEPDTPQILTNSGRSDLLTRGGAPRKSISDHLPIFVRFDL